jgi:hypothetical protein
MNLEYAVDRLYETEWIPSSDQQFETLPDGRKFPSVTAIQQEFSQAGLELSIKHNPTFKCYRATWAPRGQTIDPKRAADDRHGTVIGKCEREAAVYALAQLRAAQLEKQLAEV